MVFSSQVLPLTSKPVHRPAVINLFEVGIVSDGFYSFLLWDDFISQAITATARNSNPLVRCIVAIEAFPCAVSTLSSRSLNGSPECE